MQLKNNLYKIISKEEDSSMVNYTIELNPSCVIYQAHFPKEPITPGVCIVQIGKELIEELLTEKMSVSCKLEIVKVKNVKFLSVISPRDTLHIMYQMKKVELSDDNKMVEAQWVVLSDEKVMAKTSLVMKVV
ncbi:hydroxymyristoyl-ACP dehydratase [Prevotella aurantiaca]|jgi:putative 3-hydroxymyristoyl/3-hydroxydecanoyl-(acyl carrier protein) dehydratase|uniref:hydroxymyristoyl-ACP dehydratase n=1 Tax=Prevotella aurantiaca TaxID=596085 RepID=UPI001CB5119D|nr:hydroxymyristoyl-ACP dehydratase [Prevotella aurantiaca]MBF1385793.1 hydroxymyristoyl-ACP dehydratase [Prevotella aurantiaca]